MGHRLGFQFPISIFHNYFADPPGEAEKDLRGL